MNRNREFTVIKCYSKEAHFETWFTNDKPEARCDAPMEKGGGDAGFNPHELVEAALASCKNIWVRMYAAGYDIPLAGIRTEWTLDRQTPGDAIRQYVWNLKRSLAAVQLREAQACPGHQALSGNISFNCVSA